MLSACAVWLSLSAICRLLLIRHPSLFSSAHTIPRLQIAHAGLFVRDPAQELAIEAEIERQERHEMAADKSAARRAASDGSPADEAAAEDGAGRSARIAKVAKERQMRQVMASLSSAPAAADAKRASPAGGAGAAPGASAAPAAAAPMEVQVNAVAGLLAQKHGLRAGRVVGQVYGASPAAAAPASAAAAKSAAAAVPAAAPVLSRAAAAAAPAAEAEAAAPAAADDAAAGGASAAAAAAPAPAAAAAAAAAPAGGDGGAGGAGPVGPAEEPRAPEASSYTIYIGNVNKSTEATVEFGQKRPRDMPAGLAAEVARARSLPFQLQIAYTRKDGAQLLRVITSSQPVTREASRAHSAIAASPMVSHAARSAAALAKGGRYGACATVNDQYRSFLSAQVRADDEEGATALKAWSVEAEQLNSVLRSEMAAEATRTGRPPRSKAAAASSAAPRSRWMPMGSAAAATPAAGDSAPSLVVGGPSPAPAPIRDAPHAPGRPGRALAEGSAAGASPATGGGFFASIGRAFGFASASPAPSAAASPALLSVAADKKDAAPAAEEEAPAADAAAGGAGALSPFADGLAAGAPAEAAAFAAEDYEDGDDYDEAEEDDAVGAAGAADRIARRAGNDDLAAQISAMSKGGKKYASKR